MVVWARKPTRLCSTDCARVALAGQGGLRRRRCRRVEEPLGQGSRLPGCAAPRAEIKARDGCLRVLHQCGNRGFPEMERAQFIR